MHLTSFTSLAILALMGVVSGQTYTACNPLKKGCPADPALGNHKLFCDFTRGACNAFKTLPGTTLKYEGKGAVFSISSERDAPTVQTGQYIFFGRVDMRVRAAPGAGIVTSAVLQSDDLDEIDWEWIGGDNKRVQSNYFSKGDTTTYDRGRFHEVNNPTGVTRTYSLEWTSKAIVWSIDGQVVRTLTSEQAKGGSGFPQTPMQIKLGTWVAGRKDAPKGTVEWAGGYANFATAPFNAYYESITIVDYAGGSGPGKDAKLYEYTDKSGSFKSIKVSV